MRRLFEGGAYQVNMVGTDHRDPKTVIVEQGGFPEDYGQDYGEGILYSGGRAD